MLNKNSIPYHVAIIPDGNRRWAKERGMEPWQGHEAGAKTIEKLVRKAFDLGIRQISFWGSSLENLKKRPLAEKKALLGIYEAYFQKLIDSEDVHKNQARINIIGRWEEQFPEKLKKILRSGIERTKNYKNYALNFFLAYNGDDEMIEAISAIVKKCDKYKKITASVIKENLMTRELPPVDYLIRTGGDPHLSVGFMMWDVANAQLYFSEKLFPDFDGADLEKAIEDYGMRGKRMGK